MLGSDYSGYVELNKLAQYIGVKANTLYRRINRDFYNSRRIPINKGEEPTKLINGKTYCSDGLACAILLYDSLKKMKEEGKNIAPDEYGYLRPDDFKNNFNYLKKKLINNLKSDDRYTKATERIINNIGDLFSRLLEAYSEFEPHNNLEDDSVVGIIGNVRLVAKRNDKNRKINKNTEK